MNGSTHNKHFIFHAQACTRVYDVCFDLFRLSFETTWLLIGRAANHGPYQ